MQKNIVLLYMVAHCAMIQAIGGYGLHYTLDTLAKNVDCYADYKNEKRSAFIEALHQALSGDDKAIELEFQKNVSENKKEEQDAILLQDDSKPGCWATPATPNSKNGLALQQFAQRKADKDKINEELKIQAQEYKNKFNLAYEIDRKIFIMTDIYLRGLEKCGKDGECLLDQDGIKWEDVSTPGFIEKQCSNVYTPAIYQGAIVLTREQKIEATQNDPKLKELAGRLEEAKKAVQDKIDILKQ